MTHKTIEIETAVLGAGIGGLGAAWWLKQLGMENFAVFDSSPKFTSNLHNGVHYLHSLPNLPSLPLTIKEVTLTDGVLRKFGDANTAEIADTPSLQDSLKYSKKVREIQHPSSIMSVGKRKNVYLPQSNNMNDLTKTLYDGVGEHMFMFDCLVTEINRKNKIITINKNGKDIYIHYKNVISTLPLNIVYPYSKLTSVPVYITNCKVDGIVPNWLINLYVPNSNTSIYRVSILNNIASFESVRELNSDEIHAIKRQFAMFSIETEGVKTFVWNTGKVLSISRDERYNIVSELMHSGWYQIGRFGLWNRKLLMDSTIRQAEEVVRWLNGKNKTYKSTLLDVLSK